jgi:hypothetical protein
MRLTPVLILIVSFALCACSPTPLAAPQNETTQQTPTPKKDKSIHVSEKGW